MENQEKINQFIDSYELKNWELVYQLTSGNLECIAKRICSENKRMGGDYGDVSMWVKENVWDYQEIERDAPFEFIVDNDEPGLTSYTIFGNNWMAEYHDYTIDNSDSTQLCDFLVSKYI